MFFDAFFGGSFTALDSFSRAKKRRKSHVLQDFCSVYVLWMAPCCLKIRDFGGFDCDLNSFL